MDPVSALGFATAIVQYVAFASQLLTSATEIRHSTVGMSVEFQSIDNIYSTLRTINGKLAVKARQATVGLASSTPAPASAPTSTVLEKHYLLEKTTDSVLLPTPGILTEALALDPEATLRMSYASLSSLLNSCESDCARIMDIVSKLKTANASGSRWDCFRAALGTVGKRDEIAQIEKRLDGAQRNVMMEMANISHVYHGIHFKTLLSLKKQSHVLGVQQDAKLKSMEVMLHQLIEAKDTSASTAVSSTSTRVFDLERALSELDLSRQAVSRNVALVRSLSFQARTVRHDAIPAAHKHTFQWVFRSSETRLNAEAAGTTQASGAGDLTSWLKTGNGTFWVSGKPGSGKSTFMKFIVNHPQTRVALSQWAHPVPIIIANYYFWSPGTDMQKSFQGLLQGLLYDVICQCPELGRVVCPDRWATLQEKEPLPQEPWTVSELLATLKAISVQTQVNVKICFFIDGLDEFKGDHNDFCEDLLAMMGLATHNTKFCVSSRPWNMFEDFFGQDRTRKLYIHELTRSDIAQYTKDRLHQHHRWRLLVAQTPRAKSLVDNITEKSRGVFLWVFIVIRMLRESLTNDDSFSDLKRRLESFPSDLEAFFRQILDSVPAFYKEKMAITLQIALAAKEPLSALIHSFNDGEDDTCDYSLDFGFDSPSPACDAEALKARYEQVARRINGRCRCLLELNFLGEVDFLHRTVVDFLRTKDMSDYLSQRTPLGFSPNLAIFKVHTAWLNAAGVEDGEFSIRCFIPGGTSGLMKGVSRALSYAARAEEDALTDLGLIDSAVDDMEHKVTTLTSGAVSSVMASQTVTLVMMSQGWTRNDLTQTPSFQEMILGASFMGYWTRKISRDRTFLTVLEQPAILAVLCVPRPKLDSWPAQVSDKLQSLFRNGYSPNDMVRVHATGTENDKNPSNASSYSRMASSWEWFLQQSFIHRRYRVSTGPRFIATLRGRLFSLFLDNGADANISWAPERSAIDSLIMLSFDLPEEKALETAYLDALDSFIQHGSRVNDDHQHGLWEPWDYQTSGYLEDPDDDEEQGRHSPDLEFLPTLARKLHQRKGTKQERLPFLLEVMAKIVPFVSGDKGRLLEVMAECSEHIPKAVVPKLQPGSLKRALVTEGAGRDKKISRQYRHNDF